MALHGCCHLLLAVAAAWASAEAPGEKANAELVYAKAIVLYESGDYEAAAQLFHQVSEELPAAARFAALCERESASEIQLAGFEDGVAYPVEEGGLSVPSPYAAMDCGSAINDHGCCSTCGCSECNCGGSRIAAAKPYHLTVLTGHHYDSNVTLQPEFTGLGSGQDLQDSSWLAAAFGDYQVISAPDINVGVTGSAFTNHYFSYNEFNSQDFMAGVYANRMLTWDSMVGIRYEFHESLLDSSSFAEQHRLVPNMTILTGDSGHVTLYYELDYQDFNTLPLVPAMERSGDTHSVGVTHATYTWDGAGRVYLGYRYDRSLTDGADFVRSTHMATGRVEAPFSMKSIVDAEVRYFWDDYSNPNSLDFDGRARDDNRLEVRCGLQYFCNNCFSVRLDYTFIDSDSNTANLFGVRFYDYSRHLLATQLIYDF